MGAGADNENQSNPDLKDLAAADQQGVQAFREFLRFRTISTEAPGTGAYNRC